VYGTSTEGLAEEHGLRAPDAMQEAEECKGDEE
jgi:hypothetical protein